MSDFRKRCMGRARLIGTFAAIPHPVAVEVTAQSGLDFVCIDWEHAQIPRDAIENLVRAADVHRVPAIVRVPGHGPEAIAAALDSGALGVLVPRVSTAAQAALAVKAARYPPGASAVSGPGAPPAMATASPNILARPMRRPFSPSRSRRPKAWPMPMRSPRPTASTWCSSAPATSRYPSMRWDRLAPRSSARPSTRSSPPRSRTKKLPAFSALRRRMSEDGPRKAPASSSWPATPCSLGPASPRPLLRPALLSQIKAQRLTLMAVCRRIIF